MFGSRSGKLSKNIYYSNKGFMVNGRLRFSSKLTNALCSVFTVVMLFILAIFSLVLIIFAIVLVIFSAGIALVMGISFYAVYIVLGSIGNLVENQWLKIKRRIVQKKY